ncbi:hypothetical protein HXX76_012518 [Chlamydomonas incerta]|uniref:Uncharacterized protein n=1 Tax=Chlamydomonas incerta TaxID=51695 RepID=A0A835SPF9_CHLIN|nr:hypothetical protein HXX76_012518 [Chlamydomonas incerta]|eukprot:KAG2427323.1 hypothetical protein HXX76_012518 [Chlamydomonas incerta]
MALPGRRRNGPQQQPAATAPGTSQPQRSPGSNSQPLSTDLLIQRLEGVGDTQAVLQLLKQPRSAAAEQTFLFTAALKALARLLVASPASTGGAGSGRGGKSRTKEELQELQETVRSMVTETRARVLSFPLLSDTLTSLEVLLPALGGWRAAGLRPEDAALGLLAMAADIPQAAADADNLRPVPLPLLRDAFRAALRLTQMAQQQTQQSPSAQVDAAARRVRDAVQANLRHAVFPAPGEGAQAAVATARLHGADLAAMAAAAELAVMWDVEVPPAVMQLHVGHVDQLLAAAAGPAYAHVTDVEAKRRAADADQGTSSSSSSDNDGPSTSYSAPGRGRGRAAPRGRGGRGGGGRTGRGGAAPQGRGSAAGVAGGTATFESAEPPLPAELVAAAGQLDVTSLAQLLVAWASVPVGRPAPSPEWLDRAAALALRTQDPATMSKRGQLLRQPGYSLEPGVLTSLLWALSGRLGDRLAPETQALARAVAVTRTADFTSPQMVAVLYSLGRMKSVPAREQVGEFTKRLRPHLESLSPADAVRLLQALEALGYNPPARPWQQQQPRPQNSSGSNAREEPMDEGPAPSGAEIIGRLMVMVEGLGAHGSSGVGLEAGARGLSAAPSGLLLELLRSCAAWSVPFPEDYMGALESVVEQRVLRSLPPDQINMLSTRAVAMATLAPDRGGSRTAAAAAPAVSSVANANADAMRLGLLEGVMLPLAATRQGFVNGDMFCVALRDWMEVKGWEGITVDTATSLINSFAYSKSWALVPQLRKVMEGLMERALRLPVSQPREGSQLLLAVGRALRVMGDKMQCTPADSIADKVAPAVAPLLWSAIEQLSSPKGPNASDVAAAVKGLFVEARWRVPISADGDGSSSSSSSSVASEQATRRLLAELTAAAMAVEPELKEIKVSGVAWLLEGFAALQYRPSHDTLTRLYNAAAARLGERPAKAEEVVELLNSVTGMERVISEPAAATAAAEAPMAVGPAPATGRRATPVDELKARGRLLQQLALAALQEPALPVLVSPPEGLVAATKQMAALGLRPPTQQWLSGYTTLLQGLLPQLSPTGLAHGAEGLALLGAAPPSAFLDVLLTRADKHGVNKFEPYALGLLLGGAHTLRQNALAAQAAAESRLRGAGDDDEGEEAGTDSEEADIDRAAWLRRQLAAGVPVVAPLSTAAQEAWGRAHAAFVSEARKSNPMPRYLRAQQLLVVSAVTSFELSRPPLSQQAQTAAAGGAGKAGRGSAKLAAAASATTDFRARLEAEWLAETCASLLASRKAVGLTTAGGSGGISAALLPTPAMLESLISLASRVLGGRTDGAIACLVRATSASGSETSDAAAAGSGVGSSAAAAGSAATSADEQALAQEAARSNVLEFVRLSIQDLSQSTGHRWTTSFPAWISLLRAALQAGIRLSPSELGVFASALLNFAARRTRRALTAKGSGSTSATDSGEPQAASGGSGAAKALSPEGAELMAAVWQDLEEGLEGVLLPVLPWVPPPEMLKTLRFGLLEQPPAVLTAASLRQLALMCTYVTQAAPQLAADVSPVRRMSWWANVRAELLQRAQDEEVEKAWAKVQRGSSSGGGGSSGEAAGAALQRAGDLAAVCYGLLMHGGSGREGRDSRAGGSAGAAPSGAALPDDLATWMWLQLTRAGSAASSEIVWSPSSDERLVGLRALQLLWVARAVGCLHMLPRRVWGAAFGALGPERLNSKALLPRQLAQLVVLRSEALRGSSTSAEGGIPQQLPTALPPPVAGWFLDAWLGQVATSCRRLRLAKRATRAGAIGDADGITPAVAALAVAYCQPPTQKPPQYAVVLASAALPALAGAGGAARSDEGLCLADVWAFLRRVEPWPVTGSGNAGNSPGSADERAASWTGLPAAAVAATCQRILAASKPEAEDPMRPSEAVQFTVTLLNAAAVNGSSSSGGANALEAALPLLQALVPAAEAEVWALAAQECLGRAVLASALQVGLNAVTNTEPPLGADGAVASAREVAALVVGSVAVLLQPSAQAAGSQAASASVLDARNLPPGELAPLASAIIRLCPAATGTGDGAAPRIPRAAAAVLLRLLSTAEVVDRLPVARLEAALTRFLPAQHHQDQAAAGPLPMTEAVAQAISAKLQVGSSASFARTPVGLAVQLHRCGASGVLLQRALLAERDWAGREVALLQALALAAPREPLALSLRDHDPNRTPEESDAIVQPGEGPFGQLALGLCGGLIRVRWLALDDAAAGFACLAEVVPYLEGTKGSDGLFVLYNAVKRATTLVARRPAQLARDIQADPGQLWRLLEALLALVWQEEFNVCGTFCSAAGPYLIEPPSGRVFLECAEPLVVRHQQRMAQLLRGEEVATAAASSPSGDDQSAAGAVAYWWPPGSSEQPPPGGLLGLQLPEGDPDLLSARQLGLLYGAVVIHGRHTKEPLPFSVFEIDGVQQLYLAYVTALNLLAGRTDLPPHEHLAALLGALELVVFGAAELLPVGPDGVQPVESYDFYSDRLPFERFLAPVLARYAKAGAAEQPRPAGVELWDDGMQVFGLADLSEQSMLAGLYRKRSSSSEGGREAKAAPADLDWVHLYVPEVALPAHLRLPPGRRHGQPGGDPAADAAREAYVRSVAPSFELLRRLARFIKTSRRREQILRALQQDSSFSGFGDGRWVRVLEYALDPVGSNVRAEAEEQAEQLRKMTLVGGLLGLLQQQESSGSVPDGTRDRMMARWESAGLATATAAEGDEAAGISLVPEAEPGALGMAPGKDSAPAAPEDQMGTDTATPAPPRSAPPVPLADGAVAAAATGLSPPELAGGYCGTEQAPDLFQQAAPAAIQQPQQSQSLPPPLPPVQLQQQQQEPAERGNTGKGLLGAVAQIGALGSMMVAGAAQAVQNAISGVASAAGSTGGGASGELDAEQQQELRYLQVVLWARAAVKDCAVGLDEETRLVVLQRSRSCFRRSKATAVQS